MRETRTSKLGANDLWFVGYRKCLDSGDVVYTDNGSVVIEGQTVTVRGEQEARDYLSAMTRAGLAARWNGEMLEAPGSLLSEEEFVLCLHNLWHWAETGTSLRTVSRHGLHLKGKIVLAGYPTPVKWLGRGNLLAMYEHHYDRRNLIRTPWDLPSADWKARSLVLRAGFQMKGDWNCGRSMELSCALHPSVVAALSNEDGCPQWGAPELPEGWCVPK